LKLSLYVLTFFTFSVSVFGQSSFGVRILLGVGDTETTKWDGSVSASAASVSRLEPWRFEQTDSISGTDWKISTHPIKLFLGGIFVTNVAKAKSLIVANGIVAQLTDVGDNAELQVNTAQGSFSFRASDIQYGVAKSLLNGRVLVDRVPATRQITNTKDEEDYPASAVDRTGTVWIAYIQFRHAKNHDKLRADMTTAPSDLEQYRTPTGGDQILVRKYAGGVWSEPIEITTPGLDLYRPAIAIDGKNRPWVFWSQNTGNNFDVHARVIEGGKPGAHVQISHEAGSDIDPVAVADSEGGLWVAWQGWRHGRAAIYASKQYGYSFGAPQKVSNSDANEWNPAIAADSKGGVAVAWDSYRNGNYDVYFKTEKGGWWSAEKPVAATPRYEAYPSIAYDAQGRLWVAYEEGGIAWGKDYGATKTQGTAVYQGRIIRLRGFEPDGRVVETAGDLGAVLPGKAESAVSSVWGVQRDAEDVDFHANASAVRKSSAEPDNTVAAYNNYPRLTIDATGRTWLAFRSVNPVWWGPVGSVWFEYLTSYDGQKWSAPAFLTHSDNLLDNRPALAPLGSGKMLVVGSSDKRSQYELAGKYVDGYPAAVMKDLLGAESPAIKSGAYLPLYMNVSIPADPYNNDLWANEIQVSPAKVSFSTTAARQAVTVTTTHDLTDSAAVAKLRAYRAPDTNLRIVRGEFHRHSEVSFDGGSDGSTLDQYRYILDAGNLDWVGCCDHDNGLGREYTWWRAQKFTDIFNSPGVFANMFNYERSVSYPEGHRNVLFAQRGIRTLPRLPITKPDEPGHAPDTQMLYAYLKHFNGIVASHTSATQMGTDWRDNDPDVEPIVEIFQGMRQNYEMPEAPRGINEKDAIGGWRPKGFVSNALQMGYKFGFQASSDHISTHMSYCNIYVKDVTRESVLDALRKRHVYGATDNILADVRSGVHMMGDTFTVSTPPTIKVHLEGTQPFAKVSIIKDNKYVYSVSPGQSAVDFQWRDNAPEPGKQSYYYVRGEQTNGELVWVSPMWITYSR
jgi:hypothetical protein